MAGRTRPRRERAQHAKSTDFNGSTTSYEDIPEGESRVTVLSSSNRHSVMQALQNLQEKIHRLELGRTLAAGDMECLANETARFRQMLNLSNEEVTNDKDSSLPTKPLCVKQPANCFGFSAKVPMSDCSPPEMSANLCNSSPDHPDLIQQQPTFDFHDDDPEDGSFSEAEDEKTVIKNATAAMPFLFGSASPGQEAALEAKRQQHDSSSAPSSYNLPPQTPQAVAIALTSAETRCSILEQQLAYMRTLLEAAERDRNEAQRRCRTRGAEFKTWRRTVEAQLQRMESDLRVERGRNRTLCEMAACSGSESEERAVTDLNPSSAPPSAPACNPAPAWRDVASAKPRSRRTAGTSPHQPRRASRSGPIPFVAGTATTPSHNVGLSLQAVLQMANQKSAAAALAPPRASGTARRRQADQVDRQLIQDVRVVLEELVEEFDALCRTHNRLVRQLGSEAVTRTKEQLQHQLTDLVSRMDVKGQQIGRLRAYLAAIQPPEENTTPAEAGAEAESERRARSIRFLNKARQLQSLGINGDDLDWR